MRSATIWKTGLLRRAALLLPAEDRSSTGALWNKAVNDDSKSAPINCRCLDFTDNSSRLLIGTKDIHSQISSSHENGDCSHTLGQLCAGSDGTLGSPLFGQFWKQISVISEGIAQLEETELPLLDPFHSIAIPGEKKHKTPQKTHKQLENFIHYWMSNLERSRSAELHTDSLYLLGAEIKIKLFPKTLPCFFLGPWTQNSVTTHPSKTSN